MKGLNRTEIIGNLGHSPEKRATASGTAVTTFDVAVNESWVKDGERQERVEWFRCVAWGKIGEICGEYLSKGSPVYVEGRIQQREYDGKDGAKKKATELIVREMLMLGSKESTKTDNSPPPPDNDDIPF